MGICWRDNEMKNYRILGMLVLSALLISGCSQRDGAFEGTEKQTVEEGKQDTPQTALGDFSNLDISGIEPDIPLPDHLYKMEAQGEGGWNDEKIYEEFPQLIATYGGPQADELDPQKDIWFLASGDTFDEARPLGEKGEEEINRIMYCSDELFLELDSVMQVSFHQPALIERITGQEIGRHNEWLPNEHADPVATHNPKEENLEEVSYLLDGETVSLAECVKYVEETLTENESLPRVSTPGFEYKVDYVDVYQYGDNYGLWFTVDLYYEGVKLFSDTGVRFDTVDGKAWSYVPTLDRCMMLRKNEINVIMVFDWLNEAQDSIEEVEPSVDYKTALQMLSGYLSDTHEFTVTDAQLVYSFYTEYEQEKGAAGLADGINRIEPVWMFEIAAEGAQRYSQMFILIDVQTGEVVELYA